MSRAIVVAALLLFPAVSAAGEHPPIASRPRPPGALRGKAVYVSPGHGFYHHPTLGWITQRGNNNGLVEDFLNAELCSQYLVAYLENAGADAWTCRDRCPSPVEVVVDDGDPGYVETGTWLSTSSGGRGGDARYAPVGLSETATAAFTPDIPESGLYPLYIHYVAGANRTKAALVRIEHTGGTVEVRVDQERHGSTWRLVGTFWWLRGRGQSVTISNRGVAGEEGSVVIADAIRIGGGMGSVPPNAGGDPSGRRRSDECSVYWARYQGAPATVHDPSGLNDDGDDVTCRPRYAEWEREDDEDSLYISFHSNGGGGTGTETYAYLDGTPEGSTRLRDLVHAEIVGDLRSGWDASWTDRGTKVADFGELRLLSTMPGILTEIAFHDNPADAAAEREPRFRRLAARAIYHGIARYFGGDGVALLPEPPEGLVARVSGAAILLSWSAPASGDAAGGAGAPSGYRVYRSPNGFAFDGGRAASAGSARIEGLVPGTLAFFRVTAVNAGGESFPTKVVAARVPLSEASPRALIVDGNDRLDGDLNLVVRESSALGDVERGILDRRMNSYDYAAEHAIALEAAPVDLAIDGADHSAIEAGSVALADYDLVDWFLGREGVVDDTLNPAERGRIADYLAAGGNLLLSGALIATDLDASSSAAAKAFFVGTLGARLAAGVAGTGDVASAGAASFTSQEAFVLADGSAGFWDARGCDVYAPAGSTPCLLYGGVAAGAAGVQLEGGYRLVHLAFPLEAIALRAARDLLAARAVEFLLRPAGNPPVASIAVDPPTGRVRLEDGRAVVALDGSASHDGDGGAEGLSFRWRKIEGPAGERIERAAGWERGAAGLGYGDGDDATVLPDMRGSYSSLFLVRDFEVPDASALEGATLRVTYDDGYAAWLNGIEIARANLPAGAGHGDPAAAAIEPREDLVDLAGGLDAFLDGRNILALEVHNASLDSSDLSIAPELVARTREAVWRPVPAGALWSFHRGRTAPDAGWNRAGFDPSARLARIELAAPGRYRFELEVDDGESSDLASIAIEVLPEGGDEPFRRGDVDGGGTVDISDAIVALSWLFLGGPAPPCLDAADADDDARVDISDAIRILAWLFTGGAVPAPPGPTACGPDPTPDDGLDCAVPTCP